MKISIHTLEVAMLVENIFAGRKKDGRLSPAAQSSLLIFRFLEKAGLYFLDHRSFSKPVFLSQGTQFLI